MTKLTGESYPVFEQLVTDYKLSKFKDTATSMKTNEQSYIACSYSPLIAASVVTPISKARSSALIEV